MTWNHHHRRARRYGRRARHRFGPWEPRARFFGPGEVRLALLSLLGARPQHGYELMKGLEQRAGGNYRASAGSVYPTLQQLEDEGLVTSLPQEGKRVYCLTDAGRRELENEADAVRDIWRRADDWGSWGDVSGPEAAELWRPAMQLVKTALRSLARSDDPNRVEDIRAILKDARSRIRELSEERS